MELTSTDLSAFASILVAIATFTLAYFTWSTLKQTRKEYAVTRKQLLLLQHEKDPKLLLASYSFKGDSLNIKVKNIGDGEAYSLAVVTNFYLSQIDIREYRTDSAGKRIPYGVYVLANKPLKTTLEGKLTSLFPRKCANFVSKNKKESIVLYPYETIQENLDLNFLLEEDKQSGHIAKNFSELKDILRENKTNAVWLHFSIEYKNNLEDIVDYINLAEFVFDINAHKNLEEACAAGIRLEYRQLGQKEIETEIGWEKYDNYKNNKSSKNYFPEQGELEI